MLPLVVFASLQSRHAPPVTVDADPDFEEESAVVPAENLRAEDIRGRVLVRGLQQPLQARGVGSTVVVQEPYPSDDVVGQRWLPGSDGREAGRGGRPEAVVDLTLDDSVGSQ